MKHFIEEYSKCPNVNFLCLLFPLVYLRCHVFKGAAESILSILLVNAGSEVGEFWSVVCCYENILRFDVPVNHPIDM